MKGSKGSQPPSLENPFVGELILRNGNVFAMDGLNLQAWRIPLWERQELLLVIQSRDSLNLQAWRIPLWVNKDRFY